MKIHVLYILLAVLTIGCKKNNNAVDVNYAYIGGEIINPNTNFIVLSKNDTPIDTINLDGRNRFIHKIEDLEKGIYTFQHGGEYQIILLEPLDSVLLRLNTLDFDESLVFTGLGAKKNNYLINEYLENEQEEKHIVKLCLLEPKVFQKKVDSLRLVKIKKFEFFKKKCNSSPLFDKIAQANIDYSYYSSKEIYPFYHPVKNKGRFLKSLPKDFYSYRKNINYDNGLLSNYHKYYSFLKGNLSNLSLEKHSKHTKSKKHNWLSLCYNMDRLHIIDSLIADTTIKDDLLHKFTINFLSKSKSEKNNEVMLKSYLDKCSDEEDKKKMITYLNSSNNLKPNTKLPNIKVVNYSNNEFEINELINTPTVVSFWSYSLFDHFKDTHKIINDLKIKYPEVNFITINIDDYSLEKSKKSLKNNRFSCKNEYVFKTPEKSKEKLAIYPITKAILIGGNKRIVNSQSNVFSKYFEQELLGLINN